ncbi:hypothetical protein ACFOSC_20590 [Streptantibioticus rubrisoli]
MGDGATGSQAARYDRFIATYAVATVPWAWITQIRLSGRLVFR